MIFERTTRIPHLRSASVQRGILLALTSALALVLGFWTFSPTASLNVVSHAGYWLVLIAFGWFVWSLARLLVRYFRGHAWTRRDAIDAVLLVALGTVLQVHEPRGFKILMDEIMLLGASMGLHYDKVPLVPMRGHDLQGAFELLSGMLDKRPLFFPVLLSLVHDITGYRPENAFWLNGALGYLLMLAVYAGGRLLAGRFGGLVAALALATVPLLSQNITGGGFELLNLCMIAVVGVLAFWWARSNDQDALSALVLGTVLLAQTRYESVLFVMPIAVFVGLRQWQRHILHIPGALLAAPLLLVGYPLQHAVFKVRETSWQLFSKPEYSDPFSLRYIPDNLGHAAAFLFDTSNNVGNSLLLSAAGLLALGFSMPHGIRIARKWRTSEPVDVAWWFIAGGFGIWLLTMLAYFWGKFDDPIIRRLSLPLHLWMAWSVALVLREFRLSVRGWWCAVGVFALFLFGWSVPAMARHAYTLTYVHARETAWRREMIERRPERDFLVIDNSSIIWITHRVSSTPIGQARARREAISFLLRNRSFSSIYVWQHLDVEPETGKMTLQADDDLGAEFSLEVVEERQLKPFQVTRLSRVVAVEAKAPTAEEKDRVKEFDAMTPEERERLRLRYFETWLRKLP